MVHRALDRHARRGRLHRKADPGRDPDVEQDLQV